VRISIPIINVSWHGGTLVLLQLANHLAADGHEVTLLVSKGRLSPPMRLSEAVRVKHVGMRTRWKYLDYAVFLALLPFRIPRHSLALATFFVTYYPVRLAAALRGGGYAYFVQDIEAKYRGLRGLPLNVLCRLTYRDTRIIAANSYLEQRLREEFGVCCRSVCVGPREPFYRESATPDKRYDLIYFARRESWKGLDRFRRFMSLAHGRFSCLCVSQDEQLLASLGLPGIDCRRPADDEELIQCIDSARLLFFTSYHEGFALPPLEAMARGVPSVLYRCGGPEAYVEDGINAVYVDSERRAVETIAALLLDPGAYRSMSGRGVATAAKFRLSRALEQLTEHLLQFEHACRAPA
jgi:glycosyltransferase involved in cell wall biosynthesis